MYVHYKCRCELCCKAEHDFYVKRHPDSQRTNSKWGEIVNVRTTRAERQRVYNKNRYVEYSQSTTYKKRLRWWDLTDIYGMTCASCGCELNPDDVWTSKSGRKCYGRTYPTVDHIVSLKNGGLDTLDNVQLLCKHCNSAKGAKI
jgi:5-methylcytosine-specific restriction endonuclease McrA